MRISLLLLSGLILSGTVFRQYAGTRPERIPALRADSLVLPARFCIGRPATPADIRAWDIDIKPDGTGLPAGSGNAVSGQAIYRAKCAACHGLQGEGPQNRLVRNPQKPKEKTIGTYWPYATTLFDYIRRSMPFNAPGSLSDQEVYHLTAFLLRANGLIDSTATLNAKSLPAVSMPARPLFVPDDRTGGAVVK